MRIRSIVPNFLLKTIRSLVRGHNHLTEYRFFFFEIGELLLEMIVFLLLVGHSQF